MKRKIITILLITLFSITLKGQVSTQNYINTRTVLNQQQTSYVDNIAYFDGIGRPFQNVEIATDNGTAKSTIATLQEYDNAGRQSRQWLPVAISGTFSDPATFKSIAAGLNGHNDANPYTLPVYETSPLNRIAQQYGTGEAWHTNNKSVRTEYLTNTQSSPLSCKLYSVSNDNITGGTSYYTNGTLQVVKTLDEDSKVSYTFTDKLGRTILQRVINGSESLDTYFVYDALGNLRFVLQPEYQDEASLDKYAFQYKYNKFNLCCWKKIPGAEHVTYTYNENGLLTASQDGNQRNAEDSTTYTYDALYRIKTQNGIVNHYDNYDFIDGTNFSSGSYQTGNKTYSKGKLTGKEADVIGNGSTAKIRTVYHYDSKGRVIKTIQNNLMDGYDITETTYTYTGKPSTVTHTHTASNKTPRTEITTYTYDEKDRISEITHELSNSTEVTLVTFAYDAYGRVTQKRLHGTNNVNYQYNIRNWVTGINATKFQQNLYYNAGNGTSCYNGNISSITWKSGNETTTRGYKFTYDGANRMTGGTYGEGTAINSNADRFSESATYDKNGNILSLQRRGQTGSSTYGLLDNLSYTYNGNQITKIEDAVSMAAYSGNTAFTNGSSTSNEYAYDANGNITKDLNKGISNIKYNLLNLPEEVTFTNGNSTKFFYSAEGEKLRAVHKTSGSTTQVDYCGNIIYEAGEQKYLLNQEGYYDLEAGGYHYYLKDHLGNNRVVITQSGAVEQTTHYYPYGGTFSSTSNGSNTQPYKYNGKELDAHNGLNWYDYGARHYDPAIARWTSQDPLAEKYYGWNPYNYCAANPENAIDKEGKLILFINGFHVDSKETANSAYWNNFDNAIKNHFNDDNFLYFDGSIGGLSSLFKKTDHIHDIYFSNISARNRYNAGYNDGIKQAQSIIENLERDNEGNITESIKVITHSMGSVYSKGFLQALTEYIQSNPSQCNGVSITEYNFAPFQPWKYAAINGVNTFQYSHFFDLIASNIRIPGATKVKTLPKLKNNHSICDFFQYINSLEEGTYKFVDNEKRNEQ